ncbi:MAG: hypothetical protein ACI8QC_002000 [Planctomycetota bacterium]|jgi:hypothetical protein
MLTVQIVEALLLALGVYLALGVFFAVAFLRSGVERIDPVAKGAGWGFRALILPGCVAFWPLLLLRWRRGAGQAPVERGPHRDGAKL